VVNFIYNVVNGVLNWQINFNGPATVDSFTIQYEVDDYTDDFSTIDYLDKTSLGNDMLWDIDNDQLRPPLGTWTNLAEDRTLPISAPLNDYVVPFAITSQYFPPEKMLVDNNGNAYTVSYGEIGG